MCRKKNVDKVVGIENKKPFSVIFNHFQEKQKKKVKLPLSERLVFLGINAFVV